MGLYAAHVLPWMTHHAMGAERLTPYRARAAALAQGVVVELGCGSGLNLPFYSGAVERWIGIEPSEASLSRAGKAAAGRPFAVELRAASAEALDLADSSVDTVISTWSLCTIPDVKAALAEVRRVLKPTGRFVFAEHGLAEQPKVALWQHRLTPLWRCCSGGCHLDRAMAGLIEDAGLKLGALETGYLEGPRLLTFMYEGWAQRG